MNKKGFTLVELLIVIGILAVLSTATVLILNPAQILAETRDSQRLNDLSSISSAISLYMATADAPAFSGLSFCTTGTVSHCGTVASCTERDVRAIGSTGWVDVALAGTSGGSPLSVLPMDPSNGTTYFYIFKSTTALKFELNANMESSKYSSATTGVERNAADGGDCADAYEVGSDLTLVN